MYLARLFGTMSKPEKLRGANLIPCKQEIKDIEKDDGDGAADEGAVDEEGERKEVVEEAEEVGEGKEGLKLYLVKARRQV